MPGFGSACITVFEDDKAARHLAHNPVCASNLKHIDFMHHFLRHLFGFRGEADIFAIEPEQRKAEFLMKAIAGPDFRVHQDCVMNT